jgi:hypothetical protein
MEPLVVVWSPSELSPALTRLLGLAIVPRVYLFPILSPTRTVALLMAEGEKDELDVEALELLSIFSGQNLRALSVEPPGPPELAQLPPPQLITIQPAASKWNHAPPPAVQPEMVAAEERQMHLRARRFARVRIAEMRLYQDQLVKAGQAAANLYESLRSEIDRARESFQREFLDKSRGMADYLHEELVRTLANDNPVLLGKEYPGPLV